MSTLSRLSCVAAALSAVALSLSAHGQEPIVVTARGRAAMSRPVSHVRVSVDVIGVGDDAAAAAASLETNMKEALGRLSGLRADPGTIVVGGIRVAVADPAPPVAVTLNIGEPTPADLPSSGVIAGLPALPPVPAAPQAVEAPVEKRLQRMLTFDVPVRGGTPAEVMLEIDGIEGGVRDADLSGVKRIEARRAEADAAGEAPGRPCLCGIGVPRFDRIRRLTASEHVSLATTAVADASKTAEIMAQAVGGAIDGVVSIESIDALANAVAGDVLDVETAVDVVVRFRLRRE